MTGRREKPRGTTAQVGYWAAKHALEKFGSHVIDGRTRIARALDEFRNELVRDLGGPEAISKQQEVVISLAVRTHLLVHSIDNYLLSIGSLVNRRKRSLWPVVRERVTLADSLARYMGMLGLEKREKPIESLQEYISRMDRESAVRGGQEPREQGTDEEPGETVDEEPPEAGADDERP